MLAQSTLDQSGRVEARIEIRAFRIFLSETATWAREELVVSNGFQRRVQRKVAEHELVDRLYYFWDVAGTGALSLQDVVSGLDVVCHSDLMGSIGMPSLYATRGLSLTLPHRRLVVYIT